MLRKLKPTIAVIDSGMGGVSVLKQLLELNSFENYIYFADNLHMPYGKLSPKFLRARVEKIINMLNEKYCVDLIVVACNTASSVLDATKFKNVITMEFDKSKTYLATPLTRKMNEEVNVIADCRLAKMIEDNILNKKKLKTIIKNHITFLGLENYKEIVLGCTHYELVADIFREILPETRIIKNSENVVKRIDLTKFSAYEVGEPTILVLQSKPSKRYRETLNKLIRG